MIKTAVLIVGENALFRKSLPGFFAYHSDFKLSLIEFLEPNRKIIQSKLLLLCDSSDSNLDLVVTFGSIGCAVDDVVPETTSTVLERPLPALTRAFYDRCDAVSLRPNFGLRGSVVVANFPGGRDLMRAGRDPNLASVIFDNMIGPLKEVVGAVSASRLAEVTQEDSRRRRKRKRCAHRVENEFSDVEEEKGEASHRESQSIKTELVSEDDDRTMIFCESDDEHIGFDLEDPSGITSTDSFDGTLQTNAATVDVGKPLFRFLKTHPLTKGLVLNRGKRALKKRLVAVRETPRKNSAVAAAKESWSRGGRPMRKNWLDDEFVLTDAGVALRDRVRAGAAKDTSVCSWYLFCPGSAQCRRRCGGLGVCLPLCAGKRFKQDRHNCAVMVKLRIFVGDIAKWRVVVEGAHDVFGGGGVGDDSTRLFGDEEKLLLEDLINREGDLSKSNLFERIKSHFELNGVKMTSVQNRRVLFMIDRYMIKRRAVLKSGR